MAFFKAFILSSLLLASVISSAEINHDSLIKSIKSTYHSDTGSIKQLITKIEELKHHDNYLALEVALLAYDLSKDLPDGEIKTRSIYFLGLSYMDISDFANASIYITEALQLAEKTNNKIQQIQCLNSIGNLYGLQEQGEKAIGYYQKCLALANEIGLEKRTNTIISNIGNIYYEYTARNPVYIDSAMRYYKKSYAMVQKYADTASYPRIYNILGLCFIDKKLYDSAYHYLNLANYWIIKNNNLDSKISYYSYMGRLNMVQKKNELAITYYDSCLTLCRTIGSVDFEMETYLGLSDVYAEMGDYKKAYENYYKHSRMRDSLINQDNFAKTQDIQNRYEKEKKQRELETLQLKSKKQELITSFLIAAAFALLIIVFLIFRQNRTSKKNNYLLQQKNAIIEEKNKDITDSINYAQKIQYAILPHDLEIKSAFRDAFILFKPRDVVSGDFYWYTQSNNKKYLAVADCTGHGVPGALMSMIGSSLLNQIVSNSSIQTTGHILDELKSGIVSALKQKEGESKRRDGMDICLISIHSENKQLEFSGANNSLYQLTKGEIKEYSGDKQPVGQHEGNIQAFTTQLINYAEGDQFILYTDGYADQFGGEKGKKIKYSKFKQLLLQIHTLTMEEQRTSLNDYFEHWKGKLEQVDDVLVIGIQV